MVPVLKLLLFPLMAGIIGLAGFVVYRYCNEKIIGSRTLPRLLLFTFLLIAINTGIVLLGIYTLIRVYEWLS